MPQPRHASLSSVRTMTDVKTETEEVSHQYRVASGIPFKVSESAKAEVCRCISVQLPRFLGLQVTLSSCDGQTFQVPKKVAELSNTIRDTLEGTCLPCKSGPGFDAPKTIGSVLATSRRPKPPCLCRYLSTVFTSEALAWRS